MAKKKNNKPVKAKPTSAESGTRNIIRLKLPEGEESSRRSRKALVRARAKARRLNKHPGIEFAFAWWPDLKPPQGDRTDHDHVEILADVYANTEAEAKKIVAWASFAGAGRRRKGRRR